MKPRPPVLVPLVLVAAALCAAALPAQDAAQQRRDQRALRALFSARALQRGDVPAADAAASALQELQGGALAEQPAAARYEAMRTVLRAALRGGVDHTPLRAALTALRAEHGWDFEEPLQPAAHTLPLLLTAYDARLHQTLPAGELVAHPAAARFPGVVPAAAPRVVGRDVEVDPAVPRWQSTGLYAVPGETVTLALPELPDDFVVTAVVGAHTDSVLRRGRWQRFPQISRRWRLQGGGEHRIANAFGGAIHLSCSSRDADPFTVRLDGAVAMPVFRVGVTDPAAWREEIRERPVPFGELQGDRLILSLPSTVLRGLDDPAAVCRFWDRVVQVQDELAHFDRDHPERFVFDRQISVGYMHSGYPLMGPVSAAPRAVDLDTLRTEGNWGMFHEIGHNHQTVHYGRYANPWTFDGNVEVTVNIFSAYTYVAALEHTEGMGHQHWRTERLAEELAERFTSGPYAERSHGERCLFWVQLIDTIGYEGVRELLGRYAALPRDERPREDRAKRGLLLRLLGEVAGVDATGWFAAWGLEVGDAAREAIAGLPPFEPRTPLPPRDG